MLSYLRKHVLFFSIVTALLFLSFAFDVFGAANTSNFLTLYKDSEALVVNEIACGGHMYHGLLLVAKTGYSAGEQFTCAKSHLVDYASQFGLQGRTYTLGYKLLSPLHISIGSYVRLAQLLTALVSALCFALFALWVRQRYGQTPALVLTFLIAISPMPVGFARNLYWALPLLVAPFIYTIWAYDQKAAPKKKLLFWLIVGLLMTAKFLSGYEYLTTLTIMVAAAVAFHLYLKGASRNTYFKEIGITFLVAIASFAVALSIHVASLLPVAGSFKGAITDVEKDAFKRTIDTNFYAPYAIAGLQTNLPDFFQITNAYTALSSKTHSHHPLIWAILASGLNYIFMPVINSPIIIVQPLATYLQSFAALVAALVALFIARRKWLHVRQRKDLEALVVGSGVGVLAYVSWFVFAPAHSFVHAFLNGILIFMPMALFAYVVIGIFVQYLLSGLGQVWHHSPSSS